VSDEPAVETSWEIHSNVKSRRRKTANIEGAGATATVIEPPDGCPRGAVVGRV